MKKNIKDIELKSRTCLVRCDFNVHMEQGEIEDGSRIDAALPTIEYMINHDAKVVLMSHMGRPEGQANPEYSLAPVAEYLSKALNKDVLFPQSDMVVDDSVREAVKTLKVGDVALLENTRFRPEETKNDAVFSKELAELGDIFVNDAFGTAHRAHCSTAGIADYIPAVSGFLIEKELKFLGDAINNPRRPFVAIMGGSKVSDKILVIESLLDKVDTLLIGGGMTFTFFKAKGYEIGSSILDEKGVEVAGMLMKKAADKGVSLILPVDTVCAREFANDSERATVDSDKMPKDMMGMDIGPKTRKIFEDEIRKAKAVIWNGPMGVFEMSNFAEGTELIGRTLADLKDVTTVIGGGDSAAAIRKLGLEDKMTHVSTGGGASLEFLGGKELPGVAVLEDK